MYAIISSGGKQYKVTQGDILRVEKLEVEVGSEIVLDKVLMVADGDDVKIGQPVVEGATVKGTVVEQGKAKKILVFKYKRRKRFHKMQGHRQQFTAIKINGITQ